MTTPEQLGDLYLRVHHRMRRAFDGGMNACGVSLARTKVLTQLRRGPPGRAYWPPSSGSRRGRLPNWSTRWSVTAW